MATWEHGNMGTWKHGNMATWQDGDSMFSKETAGANELDELEKVVSVLSVVNVETACGISVINRRHFSHHMRHCSYQSATF